MPGEQNTAGPYFVRLNLVIKNHKIDLAVRDLINLTSEDLISMDKISWWLLKYEILFDNISSRPVTTELPSYSELFSSESKFRSLYRRLDELETLKSRELIFQERFELYKLIKDDPIKFEDWIDLNKEEALGSHFDLWFEWTDHGPDRIIPFLLHWGHLKISISIAEFEYTLKVLEIFHEYYWKST